MKSLAAFFLLWTLAAAAFGGVVTGTATFRERMALPPGAVFEATLEDVSKADAAAKVLGQVRVEPAGNPPIRFEISYDESRIEAHHSYAVRGRILSQDTLLFTTDRLYPVLGRGQGHAVDLMLRRVPAKVGKPRKPQAGLQYVPTSFEGVLPCADCPGIRYRLDLFAERVYYQRTTYLERGLTQDSIGNWTLSGDGNLLSLTQSNQVVERFAVKDSETLRKLDGEGQPIDSKLNHDLKRLGSFKPIEPSLTMRGLYSHLADSGIFIECHSKLRLPVAQEADNAALEAAYLKTRREAGERLLVEVQGRIAPRPKVDVDGEQPNLVVERFIAISPPGESCAGPAAKAQLQDTYWELTHLGEDPIKLEEQQKAPNIVLQSEQQRLGGSDGCNRLMGGYELEDGKLSFGQMASTMMACAYGMETADAFRKALSLVKSWKIDGERLELFDAAGKPVARFESRYMK